jgi:eukaryotic-like serine/threonine-protein kinase
VSDDETNGCLDEELLLAWSLGECDTHAQARIDQHIDACASCRRLIARLAGLRTKVAVQPQIDETSPAAEKRSAHTATTYSGYADSHALATDLDRSAGAEAEFVDQSGETIAGKYKLIRLLGKGGMGSVYLAEHLFLKKCFGLKLLSARFAKKKIALERFQREAVAAAAIGSPHIVDVSDYGFTSTGEAYLVMAFVDGTSLRSLILGPAKSWAFVLNIFAQILNGLASAHDRGVIHRDLKPENIMVTKTDQGLAVTIVDFGISKVLADDLVSMYDLTATGVTVGTPAYIAPEQASNAKGIDLRADLYSVGVMFFELVKGYRPFLADTPVALILQHISRPPPSLGDWAIDGFHPRGLDNFVTKAMGKEPGDRFSSAQEMNDALHALLDDANLTDGAQSAEALPGNPTRVDSPPTAETKELVASPPPEDGAFGTSSAGEDETASIEIAIPPTLRSEFAAVSINSIGADSEGARVDAVPNRRSVPIFIAVALVAAVAAVFFVFGNRVPLEQPPSAAKEGQGRGGFSPIENSRYDARSVDDLRSDIVEPRRVNELHDKLPLDGTLKIGKEFSLRHKKEVPIPFRLKMPSKAVASVMKRGSRAYLRVGYRGPNGEAIDDVQFIAIAIPKQELELRKKHSVKILRRKLIAPFLKGKRDVEVFSALFGAQHAWTTVELAAKFTKKNGRRYFVVARVFLDPRTSDGVAAIALYDRRSSSVAAVDDLGKRGIARRIINSIAPIGR